MEQAQLLERVLALTEEIDEATRIADWQRAAQLSEQRSPLVHSITAPQPPSGLALVRRIQALDQATLQSAKLASTELATEYQAASQNIQAARQYQRVARF
ncbi:flagellar protein FliT [Paraburkholderia sp. ZP32-5]|uniref:flagellar protein FliT n=1 Tax=Paraburkholderia sp. ZP32-5 TaxID=2883245 RepID=UPI001F43AA09|nr:flagellar protein FliT [Paraburkholderia sp. ZP32-5]